MNYHNASKFGPQSEDEAKQMNWHRMDCLTALKLRTLAAQQVLDWFNKQDSEWAESRRPKLKARLGIK